MEEKASRRIHRIVSQLSLDGNVSIHKIEPKECSAISRTYKNIKVEQNGKVGIITLNRPESLNALSDELIADISTAIQLFSKDPSCSVIILTGQGRAFAAGANIRGMVDETYYDVSVNDRLSEWEAINQCKIPLIAAVNGLALGGGCEIAMMADIIIAAESATFGQPEIKIGTIPGSGGTQRLPRAIGKSKAMELVLTGNSITAKEALQFGLVSAVVPNDQLLTYSINLANNIARNSRPVLVLAKEAVLASEQMNLFSGLRFERRLFHSTFALNDRKEGMKAFVEKRAPNFTNS